jgi:long-chain acyl-CoA synthetase
VYSSLSLLPDDVYLSYLPLPHCYERMVQYALYAFGGRIAFYGGDVLKLKDDLQAVRPTVFASVPRLFNKFYE